MYLNPTHRVANKLFSLSLSQLHLYNYVFSDALYLLHCIILKKIKIFYRHQYIFLNSLFDPNNNHRDFSLGCYIASLLISCSSSI